MLRPRKRLPVSGTPEDDPAGAALLYAGAMGWSVVPVGPKAPFKGTRGVHDATADSERIRASFARYKTPNVAIRTGKVSGLVVLDVDPDHGGDDALSELEREYEALPETPDVATGGGGRHVYFQAPAQPLRGSAGRIGPGLDVRAEGGYVVAPPSIHPSGRRYVWDAHVEDTPMAPLPPWLLALAQSRPRRRPARREVEEGERNARLTSLAGAMVLAGLESRGVRVALHEHNRGACRPPLPADEVDRIADSSAKWSTSPPWISDLGGFLADERLPAPTRMVLFALTRYADQDGLAWPGQRRIAQVAGVNKKRVGHHLRLLERTNRVGIIRRAAPASHAYRIDRHGPPVGSRTTT